MRFLAGKRDEAARLAKDTLAIASDEATKAKLKHVSHLVTEPEPKQLSEIDGDQVFLSELRWTSANVGWGKPARDQYYSSRSIRDAVFLELGDQFFARGLYAHAPSRYEFNLDGRWKTFEATAGLQKGVGPQGSGVFSVKGDDRVLYRSKLLKGSATDSIKLDVRGVKKLELVVESGKQNNGQCWTIWGGPRLSR